VEDAKTFDNYLCNNGYSRSINPGTYEIVPGTSEEEIAKIITGKH
jgi:cell division protein YceG involved in septum cleavage